MKIIVAAHQFITGYTYIMKQKSLSVKDDQFTVLTYKHTDIIFVPHDLHTNYNCTFFFEVK